MLPPNIRVVGWGRGRARCEVDLIGSSYRNRKPSRATMVQNALSAHNLLHRLRSDCSRKWCKTRAAHLTLVPPAGARAPAGNIGSFLHSGGTEFARRRTWLVGGLRGWNG